MAAAVRPAAAASASPRPVRATSRSKTLTTAVPTTPENDAAPPAATVPATRPVLLAAGPSGTQAGLPSTRCGRATQSPAAKMPGSDVRIAASTTTEPSGRCCAPAWSSRSVAGRTPVATISRSVPTSVPSTTAVRPAPPRGCTASRWAPSRSRAWRGTSAAARSAIGSSTLASTRGRASMTSTSTPAPTRASAVSRPMYPAPTTIALRTAPLSRNRRSLIASSRDRTVKTRSWPSPGTGGRTGSAPLATISAS